MAPPKKPLKKAIPKQNKIAKSLSLVWNFQDVYSQAVVSQETTNSLFQQVNEVAEEGKKFPILLFSNEDEGRALKVLVRKYNYRGAVRVTQGVSKDERRDLKRLAKELQLSLQE